MFTRSARESAFHFLHHPASVSLHGDFADAELGTDLFIQ